MEKLQRVFKPLIEMALAQGMLERRPHKVSGAIKLETLLDALDARLMSYGGIYAEDLAEMILQGLNVNTDLPEVIQAFCIGFRGGQVAARSGADLMDMEGRLAEFSPVGEHEAETEGADE